MRINTSQLPENSILQVRTRAGVFTNSLDEGDIIKAEVLSGEKGSVVMRADGGQVFRARLDSGVTISRGEEVFLQVTGKEEGVLFLALREQQQAGDAEKLSALTREFEDKSLAPFAGRLAQLGMPVSEESARVMRDLMARYPDLTPDEAAFIAANKLYGDEDVLNAAIAFLSDGEKTDAMIEKMLELLSASGTSAASPDTAQLLSDATHLPLDAAQLPSESAAQNVHVHNDQEATLTGFLSLIKVLAERAADIYITDLESDARIISQSESSLQFRNDVNVEENSQNVVSRLEQPMPELQSQAVFSSINGESGPLTGAQGPGDLQGEAGMQAENASGYMSAGGSSAAISSSPDLIIGSYDAESAAAAGSAVIENDAGAANAAAAASADGAANTAAAANATATTAAAAATADAAAEVTTAGAATADAATVAGAEVTTAGAATAGAAAADAAIADSANAAGQGAALQSQFYTLLASLPEFRGTPMSALERFSDMMLRVASDGIYDDSADTEKLSDLLIKLFTRIDRDGTSSGEKLRHAKEELFARLSLIEEAISRAAPSAKGEMTELTRRLMDHVRLQSSIDQFAYMQLPVIIGQERKTAELFLFRRKGGGRKIDPDNVNILLAIDLEHLGHWEALLNIRHRDVSVRMEVPGASEKDYFNRNTVLLHKMLEEAGFRLVSTDITFSGEKTTLLNALTVLDRLSTGRIDYVV